VHFIDPSAINNPYADAGRIALASMDAIEILYLANRNAKLGATYNPNPSFIFGTTASFQSQCSL
jgi:hypothetical protein